jgi:lipoprotein-anchoring transpeptidase ErfK/SrfK
VEVSIIRRAAVVVPAAAGLVVFPCGGPSAVGSASAVYRHLGSVGSGSTQVATPRFDAPRYAAPGARPTGVVPAHWFGRPSVLPVIAARSGWVRVRLAQRPNGSTAWLQSTDVTFGSTPYRIVIDLSAMRLKLYTGGRRVLSAPAGIGTVDHPTPKGRFFLAFKQPVPRPHGGYGPFILVTSAHSPSIEDWQGSGDAVVGIHGPLGAAHKIGNTGARVSHGCVRLHIRALTRLRDVPPGTPINVVR